MYQLLTVGKLKNVISNLPDESEIWFYRENDDDSKEEATLNYLDVFYSIDDNYEKPNVSFVIGD